MAPPTRRVVPSFFRSRAPPVVDAVDPSVSSSSSSSSAAANGGVKLEKVAEEGSDEFNRRLAEALRARDLENAMFRMGTVGDDKEDETEKDEAIEQEDQQERYTTDADRANRKFGWQKSKWGVRKVRDTHIRAFLKSRLPRTREQAIQWLLDEAQTPSWERELFMSLIPLTGAQATAMWRHAQKSMLWFRARFPRKTGSEGGSILNWNPYCHVLKSFWRKVYGEYKTAPATDHGVLWEKRAGYKALVMFQQHLNQWFIEQRGFETAFMTVFGRRIPLFKDKPTDPYYNPPRAIMYHAGMVPELFNTWRGVSIDGMIVVNGIPLTVVETKCPYDKEKYGLYWNEPMYYVPQGQDALSTMMRLYPSLAAVQRVTHSPLYGTNIDLYPLDAHWYTDFYAPRELRGYFSGELVMLAEHAKCRFENDEPLKKDQPVPPPGKRRMGEPYHPERYRAFIRAEYGLQEANCGPPPVA